MPVRKKATKCDDCEYCQSCSKSRCRLCHSGKLMKGNPGLASFFTYEEYQKWKLKKELAESVDQH